MKTLDSIRRHRSEIGKISARYGIDRLRVFGSLIRDEATDASDVDFLVKVDPRRNLLDLVEFSQELSHILQCKVDVVSEDGVSPYLKDQIFNEAVFL